MDSCVRGFYILRCGSTSYTASKPNVPIHFWKQFANVFVVDRSNETLGFCNSGLDDFQK